jgi:hypothetical protein
VKRPWLEAVTDEIASTIGKELKLIDKQITVLDEAIREINTKIIDHMIVSRAKDSESSEKLVRSLNGIRRTMNALDKKVSGMIGNSDTSSNVWRLHN